MSFNTALDSGQYIKLRSQNASGGPDYQVDYLVTVCANTVVFAGQVNQDLSLQTSWAQFNWNNDTVGAYTDVELDQVLLIAPVNDITKATYRGRIRETLPTATTIYCMESSLNFAVGAYFWVLDVYEPQYILSRPDANGNELVNYDQTYLPPRAKVRGLRTAYINYVDPNTNKMRVAFDVSTSYAVESGDSITGYLFTFAGGTYTVVSGSLSTSTVTVDFDADTEQWGKLEVTTANGEVFKRRFKVKALGTTTQPDASFKHPPITGDWQRGWSMNIAAFANADSILNMSMVVVWRYNESYGGVAGGLDAFNIAFVGWLRKEEDPVTTDQNYSVTSEAHFEVLGFGPIMGLLTAQMLPFVLKDTPTAWGEIKNLTWWRSICHFLDRYSTIAMLADLDFSDMTDTYLFPDIPCTGGNILSAVTEIANQVNAVVEYAPDGRLAFNRRAEQITNLEQASLTVVANWQIQDCLEITKSLDQNRQCGVVDADGGTYNSITKQVNFYTSRAPGHAMGEAQGRETLSNQILPVDDTGALTELRQRAGNHYNISNNNEVLHVKHPDGYAPIFTPSRYQLFTFTVDTTLAGAQGVNRINYTTDDYWLLESVSLITGENGVAEVSVDYRKLIATGDLGDNTTLTAPGEVPIAVPDIGVPAFDWEFPELTFPDAGLDLIDVNPAQLLPPEGKVAMLNGQEMLVKSNTQVFWLKNFITLKAPQALDITPPDLGSFTVRMVLVDPASTSNHIGGYFLASDGTDSAIWYNANVASPDAAGNWVKGANFTGEYDVLRATGTPGTIMAYSALAPGGGGGSGAWSFTWDFSVSPGPWYPDPGYGGFGTWNGSAWESGDTGSSWHLDLRLDSSTTFDVNHIVMSYQRQASTAGSTSDLRDPARAHHLADFQNAVGTYTNEAQNLFGFPTPWSLTAIEIFLDSGNYGGGKNFIYSVTLSGPSNPPTFPDTATVVTSTDYGATVAYTVPLPDSPGSVGGFDVQRSGTVNYAAGAGKLYKATTLGGAYSAWYTIPSSANATCVIVPYFRRNSSTKNTAVSDPDVIIGCDNGKWYWIDGTAATATDITPAASLICSHPDALTVRYGNLLAAWGTLSGTEKAYTSSDGGGTWTFRSNISNASKLRCRRNDSRKSPNGQIYLAQANVIDFSSKWFSNALYPRTMPVTGINGFDTVI
jgi:hypothetical protein